MIKEVANSVKSAITGEIKKNPISQKQPKAEETFKKADVTKPKQDKDMEIVLTSDELAECENVKNEKEEKKSYGTSRSTGNYISIIDNVDENGKVHTSVVRRIHGLQEPREVGTTHDIDGIIGYLYGKIKNTMKAITMRIGLTSDNSKSSFDNSMVKNAEKYFGMDERQIEIATGRDLLGKSWNADFVNLIIDQTYGDDAPDWYKNCDNKTNVRAIKEAAGDNVFTDPLEAQPGDLIFLNTMFSDCNRIGIVQRVENGKIYTIEGDAFYEICQQNEYDVTNTTPIYGYAHFNTK